MPKLSELLGRLEDHRHLVDRIAYANGLLSGFALYPQVIKAFLTHEVQGLSFLTFTIILVSSLTWVVYAIHRRTFAILISSTMNSVAAGAIIGLLIYLSPH
ncbi:MAG: PQ-loop domain-containing transporter [Patescibacteria group bacterium]|jgi:uncharacterized protein with PQ loop repeat